MSYFILKDKVITYSPYTVAPSGVMARNKSNIMVTRFGLLFVLNDQGRSIADWIRGGDKCIAMPSFATEPSFGVLLDTACDWRTIVLGKIDGVLSCNVSLYQTNLVDNLVYTTATDEREQIQFSLDAGYSVEQTLVAMQRFNPIYRDAVTMSVDKATMALSRIGYLEPFRNPNIELEKDK